MIYVKVMPAYQKFNIKSFCLETNVNTDIFVNLLIKFENTKLRIDRDCLFIGICKISIESE